MQGFIFCLEVPELHLVIHNLYQALAQIAKEIAQAFEVQPTSIHLSEVLIACQPGQCVTQLIVPE